MAKKNYLPLIIGFFFLFNIINGYSQDDLKSTKYGDKIKKHLSLSKYDLSEVDLKNLYLF